MSCQRDQINAVALQITELAGYTHRVSEMFDVFGDMKAGRYERSAVGSKNLTSKNKVQGSLETMRGEEGFILRPRL